MRARSSRRDILLITSHLPVLPALPAGTIPGASMKEDGPEDIARGPGMHVVNVQGCVKFGNQKGSSRIRAEDAMNLKRTRLQKATNPELDAGETEAS